MTTLLLADLDRLPEQPIRPMALGNADSQTNEPFRALRRPTGRERPEESYT